MLELASRAANQAAEEVGDCIASTVRETTLVHDHVIDVVQLLSPWRVTDKISALVSQLFHESFIFRCFVLKIY